MSRNLNPTTQKVLLILFGGIVLGLSGSPKNYFRTLKIIKKDWQKINEEEIKKSIKALYRNKMIEFKKNKDNTCTIILSEKGKEKAITYSFNKIKIPKPNNWDKKWRVALFDIPERLRKKRDDFRNKLRDLGFFEFQKSVFAYPYNCKDEIDFVIEFLKIRPYVRFIIAENLDNELHLKKHFNLL